MFHCASQTEQRNKDEYDSTGKNAPNNGQIDDQRCILTIHSYANQQKADHLQAKTMYSLSMPFGKIDAEFN